MFRTVLSVAVALAPVMGSAAVAGPDDVPIRIVRYADLDLTHPEGVKVLQQRVSRAIEQVCGSAGIRDLDQTRAIMSCRKTAGSSAAVQVAAAIDGSRHLAARAEAIRLAGR